MNPQDIFCPNIACPAKGRRNAGNIRVHHHQERRYYCSKRSGGELICYSPPITIFSGSKEGACCPLFAA